MIYLRQLIDNLKGLLGLKKIARNLWALKIWAWLFGESLFQVKFLEDIVN